MLRLFLTMRFAHPPELTGLLSQRHSAPLEDFQQILIKESYWKSEKNENLGGCKVKSSSKGSVNLFPGDLEERAPANYSPR